MSFQSMWLLKHFFLIIHFKNYFISYMQLVHSYEFIVLSEYAHVFN